MAALSFGGLDVGGCRHETIPAPPIPRCFELTLPHSQAVLLGLTFLGHVIIGELPIRERPALGHHGGVDVLTIGGANGHRAAVPIYVTSLAG